MTGSQVSQNSGQPCSNSSPVPVRATWNAASLARTVKCCIFLLLFGVPDASAFSSEVDTGSREENASKQNDRAPFRFNRNGKGSSGNLAPAPCLARRPRLELAPTAGSRNHPDLAPGEVAEWSNAPHSKCSRGCPFL